MKKISTVLVIALLSGCHSMGASGPSATDSTVGSQSPGQSHAQSPGADQPGHPLSPGDPYHGG